MEPGYNYTKKPALSGKRLFITPSLLKKEGLPGDAYYVCVPKLSSNQVYIPDTMNVTFKFQNGNTKSRFKNNLGQILCKSLIVRIFGTVVYENGMEGLFETYKDLWKSESKRKGMVRYGICNENIRKLMSRDDSATTSVKEKDVLMEKNNKTLKINMGKILEGHGPIAPYDMSDIEYQFTLPKTEEIMVAQTGQKLANYKLVDMNLEIETIEGEEVANTTRSVFTEGMDLWNDHITHLMTEEWAKDSTFNSINISVPQESLKAVVLLFTKDGSTDIEEFCNAEVENVKVMIEENPNSVYSEGMPRSQIYEEAVRFFGSQKNKNNDNLEEIDFLTNKYCVAIDMRTVDDENVVHSGRHLKGVQSGILIKVQKLATSTNLFCQVFVVSDGKVEISDQRLKNVEY